MENNTNDNDNEIKVILLGDCGVGKTNIISRFLKDEFKDNPMTTTGANYVLKKININGMNFQVNIWDTAGQEKYKSVTKMFLQDSQILLLCYSIIDRYSFENLEFWLKLAIDITGKNIVLGVAGNKSDLYEKEQVKDSEGEAFAKEHKAIFKLVSAKINKEGIDDLFDMLFKRYINIKNGNNIDSDINSINLNKNQYKNKKDKKKKGKCCL